MTHWLEELLTRKKTIGRMLGAQAKEAWDSKPSRVVGSDEVGYGAWAGPLVVCAVAAPFEWTMDGLRDSKDTTELQREDLVARLYAKYDQHEIHYRLVSVLPQRIDELGLGEALRQAHRMALKLAGTGLYVVDGNVFQGDQEIMNLPKADTVVPQVMAASIIAKHVRDSYMKDVAVEYPGYGFENHVGYGVPEHRAAIKLLGPCALHRMSYKPFKEVKDDGGSDQDAGDIRETPRESGAEQQADRDSAADVHGKRQPADQAGRAHPGKARRGKGRKG